MENEKYEVIVVDDMPDFTINLKKILMLDEINVNVFNEPENFLEYSKQNDFDACKVLVVDYSMPNLSGYDVFKELYKIKNGHINLHKVLYTANFEQISTDEKNYLESLGVTLLKKPNMNELINLIEEKV